MFVQLVMAAITTAPCFNSPFSPRTATVSDRERSPSARPKPRSFTGAMRALRNASFIWARATRSWGRFGPGQAGLHRSQVQLQRVREDGIRRRLRAEEPLLLAVALDEIDLGRRASRLAQVARASLVHREEAAGGAVLGGHVRDGGPVGERHLGEAGAEELHELLDDALLAEELGHGQHEVGGGHAFAQLPGEPEAHHLGGHHVERLAEHGRLRLDAAHAPAQDAQAVDHRGVGIRAHERVGEGHRRPVFLRAAARPWPGTRGSPGGRYRWREARRGSWRRPSGPSAGTRSARGCARTRSPRSSGARRERRSSRPAPSGRPRGPPAPGG